MYGSFLTKLRKFNTIIKFTSLTLSDFKLG